MSYDNIKPLVEAMGELDDQIKRMTKKRDELKVEVAKAIADKGTIQFGEYQVTSVTMPGNKTLDKKALEQSGINLDHFMKVGKPYVRTTIKKVVMA